MDSPAKKSKQSRPSQAAPVMPFSMDTNYQPTMASPQQYKQYPYAEANIPHWQHASYMYPDPTATNGNVILNGGPYHQQTDMNAAYNAQSLEQLANEVLDSRYVNDGDYTVPQSNGDSVLHPALQQSSASSQDMGHVQVTSPLLAKAKPGIVGALNGLSQPVNAGPGHRSISSGGPVLPHNTDLPEPNSHDNSQALSEVVRSEPTLNPAPENHTTGTASDQHALADTATNNNNHTTTPSARVTDGAVTSPGKAPVSLSAAPMTGLANIPLYQPPPPLTKSQTPRIQRHSFSVNTERPLQNVRRSLSRTPAPAHMTETTELKTPGSSKRKRDSHSTTPGTTKSKKVEHVPREKSIAEEEEEQSLRLARELQDQDWGLRRRTSRA